MMKRLILSACAALCLTNQSAMAISIVESTDFSSDRGTLDIIGALEPGTNTISGQLSLFCRAQPSGAILCPSPFNPADPRDQGDSFEFTAPTGLVIDSLSVAFSASGGIPTNGVAHAFGVSLEFFGDPFDITLAPGSGSIDLTSSLGAKAMPDGQALTADVVLSSSSAFITSQFSQGGLITYDYTFTIDASSTSVVPLPAGLPLLLGGLVGMGLLRRRSSESCNVLS